MAVSFVGFYFVPNPICGAIHIVHAVFEQGIYFYVDSLVDFAGRHHTRAAVQRRYQVRKRADPVRHAKHKLYYRNYMKIYQQVSASVCYYVYCIPLINRSLTYLYMIEKCGTF